MLKLPAKKDASEICVGNFWLGLFRILCGMKIWTRTEIKTSIIC